ncbi:hypothetical protein Tco_0521192 [Tanacetum coccineum]
MPKFRTGGGDVEELGTELERLGLKGDACKQLRKEVGASLRCLDCMVVIYADPRVPLILERSFLKSGRALIDVYEGELTIRVGKEAITFNHDQTSRNSSNYNDNSVNRIDVIEMACEEYSQEVLGFLRIDR